MAIKDEAIKQFDQSMAKVQAAPAGARRDAVLVAAAAVREALVESDEQDLAWAAAGIRRIANGGDAGCGSWMADPRFLSGLGKPLVAAMKAR